MQTDVVISVSQLLWLAGGILTVGAVIKLVIVPFKKLDDHENRIADLQKSEADRKSIDRYIVKVLNALINFNLDENSGKEELRKVRDEYHDNMFDHL